jgi:hypothetical protein
LVCLISIIAGLGVAFAQASADESPETRSAPLHPNLRGQVAQPLRYHLQGEDFVIRNGAEFVNRSLYGGNDTFRVDRGDRPEFSLSPPGRRGNLPLGARTAAVTACTRPSCRTTP